MEVKIAGADSANQSGAIKVRINDAGSSTEKYNTLRVIVKDSRDRVAEFRNTVDKSELDLFVKSSKEPTIGPKQYTTTPWNYAAAVANNVKKWIDEGKFTSDEEIAQVITEYNLHNLVKDSAGTSTNQTTNRYGLSSYDTVVDQIRKGKYNFGVDGQYVNSFIEDANKYISEFKSDYSYDDIKSVYESEGYLNASLEAQAGKIRSYLNANKDRMDSKAYDELMSIVNRFENEKNKYKSNILKPLYDIALQSKDATEYNNNSNALRYQGYSFDNLQKEIETLKNDPNNSELVKWLNTYKYSKSYTTSAEVDKAIAAIESDMAMLNEEINKYSSQSANKAGERALFDLAQKLGIPIGNNKSNTVLDDLYDKLETLKIQKAHLEQNRTILKREEEVQAKYGVYSKDTDFLTTAENGKQKGWISLEGTLEDASLEYIDILEKNSANGTISNKVEMFFNLIERFPKLKDETINLSDYMGTGKLLNFISDMRDSNVQFMNADERRMYNYLFEKYGAQKAFEYLNDIQPFIDKRGTEHDYETQKAEYANANAWEKFVLNVESIPQNVIGGMGAGVGMAFDMLFEGEINPYAPYNDMQIKSQNTRAFTGDEWASLGGEFAKNTYLAVMCAGDSAFGALMGSKLYALSTGFGVAATEARSLYERGAEDWQIIAGAVTSGVIEGVFEKLSLDKLIDGVKNMSGLKSIVKTMLIQGGIEASEEFNTELTNMVADAIINGYGSATQQQINEYLKNGMTLEEAQAKAAADNATQLFWSAYTGFISGGVSAGAAGSVKLIANSIDQNQSYKALGEAIKGSNDAQNLIDFAVNMDSEVVSKALGKNTVAENMSAKSIGKVAVAVQSEINAKFSKAQSNTDVISIAKELLGSTNSKVVSEIVTKAVFDTVSNHPEWSNATDTTQTENADAAVDNSSEMEYNKKRGEGYVATDEFRSLQAESQGMSDEDIQSYRSGNREIDAGLRENISRIFRTQINRYRNGVRNDNGILNLNAKSNQFNIYENVDGSLFHDVFQIARKYLKNGELVDLHGIETTEDGIGYNDCYNYLSEDGLSGFSITPDGDLISVFNASGKGGFLGAIAPIVKERAKTLDCYNSPNQPLMGMYSKIFGFKTASLIDYNMEFDHDNIAKNHGNPQVAFMVNTDADVETKHFTENKYDEAVAYRDGFAEKADSNGSASFMPDAESVFEEPSTDNPKFDLTEEIGAQMAGVKRLTDEQRTIVKIGKALGYEVEFGYAYTPNGKRANGKIDYDNKKIILNPNVKKPIQWILKHELTHFGEQDADGYKAFVEAVKKSDVFKRWLQEKTGLKDATVDSMLAELNNKTRNEREAAGDPMGPAEAQTEIIADFSGDVLFSKNENGVDALLKGVEQSRKPKIIQFICDFLSYLKDKLSGVKNVSFELQRLESKHLEMLKTAQKSTTENVKYSVSKLDDFSRYDEPITLDDIKILRDIGRKSINQFSADEVEIAQKWAHKFYQQLGTKSPFFRRWFGDWRAYDSSTFVEVLEMEHREGKNPRGTYKNNDTGWVINSSSVGYDETISHSGNDKKSIIAMRNIDKIIENAVLLDTEVSEYGRGKKSIYTAFMHKFYAPISIDGKRYLVKMAVDESHAPGQKDSNKKFYHVRAIKIETASSVGIGKSHTPIIEDTVSTISISDLFNLVKQYDSEFKPNPVNEALIENGKPKTLYHQTESEFTEFDITRQGAGASDNETPFGIFLKGTDKDIGLKGKRQMALFAKMNNPLIVENREVLVHKVIQFSKEYKNYYNKSKQIDMDYSKKHEDAIKAFNDFVIENSKSDNRKSRQELYNDSEFQRLFDAEDQVVDEWQKANRENDLKAKKALTSALKNNGYDGVILKKDVGSFGRVTEAYIVFDNAQVKSAKDGGNIGTFSEAKSDIRYSISENNKQNVDYTAEFDKLSEQFERGDITRADFVEQVKALYNAAGEEYGTIPKGETVTGNENYDDPAPKSVDGKKNIRRHVRTIIEGGNLTEEMLDITRQQVLSGDLSYTPTSNEGNLKYAKRAIESGRAESMWQMAANGEEKPSANAVAVGEMLLKLAVERKDTARVVQLTAELSEMATRLGQATQAFSLLKRMDGIGQLYYVQKTVDRLNQDLQKKRGSKAPIVTINEALAQQLTDSKTKADFDISYGAIMNDIASQVPATFLDKWNAWRYMSMLFNPTTHVRNVVGNAIFCPAIKVKDTLAVGLENVFVKGENRTKSIVVKKEYKDFASDDFENVQEVITGGGKMNPQRSIADNKPIFKNKVLENARKFNFDMLEKEDAIFLKGHYIRALGGFLQARNVDLKNVSSDTLAKAREYAILEAQKATYRDVSALANVISNFANKNTFTNVLIEGVLPFKKTPINIVKRGIEYSPFGLLKILSKDLYDLKKGNITASQYIDGIAGVLTGTGIVALGMLLSSLGVIRGGFGDDEEDWFNKMLGMQEYSVEIGGVSYTIDWAAPVCMPFFMGVTVMESFKEEGNADVFSSVVNALGAGLEPFINLSMLSGIQDTIATARYAEADEIIQSVALNIVDSYFSQMLPTIGGKINNLIDPMRRSNYIDKTSLIPEFVQSALNTVYSKVPGLSKYKAEYVDAWGEKQYKGNFVERFFQSFLSPGYASDVEVTEIDAELKRLAKETGEPSVFPDTAQKNVKFKGVTKHLTADEYEVYAVNKGQLSADYISELIHNEAYGQLTDDQKVKVIEKLYKFANAKAKAKLSYSYDEINAMHGGVISKEKFNSYSGDVKKALVEEYFFADFKKVIIKEKNGGSAVDYFIQSVKNQ